MIKRCWMILLFGSVFSCGGDAGENRIKSSYSDQPVHPDDVRMVSAIGKVEPESGLVNLASSVAGMVTAVFRHAGDSVSKNDTLLVLDAKNNRLDINVLKNQLLTQQSRAKADMADVEQFEAQLAEKSQDLAISEKLVETGAETRQNVATKKREKEVLQANLKRSRENSAASRAGVLEYQAQLKKLQSGFSDKTILAVEDGVLTSMDVRVGEAVQAYATFATLAPKGQLVVHGEADEMFAHQIAPGQSVKIYTSNSILLAEGHIIYVSPILEDKSIFYDQPGEKNDRRVRRFKVDLDYDASLLINAKVECRIAL